MNRFAAAALTAVALTACETDPAAVHDSNVALDSHVDIPFDFATADVDPRTGDLQVNLDKMSAGGLDAAFFIVYVGQQERTPGNYAQAVTDAMTKFDAIHRMTETYSELIGLAESADDVDRLADEGKLIAAIGIENGFVIGTDLDLLDRYHALGGRYMTLVHNGHNDIADSAQPREEFGDQGPSEHGGVSDFGAEVIQRMNELGIMVDISHASKAAALEAMDLSAAPVIASHSSVRALTDHVRNLDDETLLRLRDDGGVVQIVAYEDYVGDENSRAVVDLVDHIDYAVDLIGIEHVGISSDFGGGGGIDGWNDATETPNITAELVSRGYSADEIDLLWSGNLLRVWRETERVAAEL